MTALPRHLIELTEKQTEVLAHLACGMDIPEIARVMQVSVKTAREHLKEAMFRLCARSGTHAVALAIGLGILPTAIATTPTGDRHVR